LGEKLHESTVPGTSHSGPSQPLSTAQFPGISCPADAPAGAWWPLMAPTTAQTGLALAGFSNSRVGCLGWCQSLLLFACEFDAPFEALHHKCSPLAIVPSQIYASSSSDFPIRALRPDEYEVICTCYALFPALWLRLVTSRTTDCQLHSHRLLFLFMASQSWRHASEMTSAFVTLQAATGCNQWLRNAEPRRNVEQVSKERLSPLGGSFSSSCLPSMQRQAKSISLPPTQRWSSNIP
jgi:hypothetical protein